MFFNPKAPWWLQALSFLLIVLIVLDFVPFHYRLWPGVLAVAFVYFGAAAYAKTSGRI